MSGCFSLEGVLWIHDVVSINSCGFISILRLGMTLRCKFRLVYFGRHSKYSFIYRLVLNNIFASVTSLWPHFDNRSRNKRRNLWVGRCVSTWWPWFPSRSSVLIYIYVYIYIYIYIYIYVHSLYEFCIYIGRLYNGSVIQYWRSCTPSRFIGECAVPGLNATFCFLWFTNCVLLFDKNLILGCLWLLVFVLNNILILGIWCSTIPHLPGCFVPSLRISDSTRC